MPFCPTLASTTSSTSWGAPGAARPATRRILPSSPIQIGAGMKTPGRIDEHHVAAPRPCRRNRIEDDRSGIGAIAGAHDIH